MSERRPWYAVLYVQVLIAIAIGVVLGHFFPKTGTAMKPLGDAFIALIKMMIAPVIFCTVVHGIASMSDLQKVGRVGLKALLYFEVVSTLALAIGLLIGEVVQPGSGFDIDVASLDPKAVASYVTRAKEEGVVAHLMAIIPSTFIDAFAKGDLLQVLLVAILTGFAAARMGPVGERIAGAIDAAGKLFFRIIGMIVRVAPIGAFGAMAFTVGAYGLGSLWNLLQLIMTFYATSVLFVVVVLGAIARVSGFSILRFVTYIKDELLIVLGTSSSETVLPHNDPEDGAARRLEIRRRAGDSDRVQLQSRWNEHLYDVGDTVPGASHQHASYPRSGAHHSAGRDADVERRIGRYRCRFRHPRRDIDDHPRYPDPIAGDPGRHRQVHE